MKISRQLMIATALTSLAASALATTGTATVSRVEDRKVLNTRAFGTPEDAVHSLMATTEGVARVGAGVPMNTLYIVTAKTPEGKRVELTAQSAPEVGTEVIYDTKTKQVQR